MKNSRFLQALLRQPVDCTPIWLMRQAGRYLPEYRALREKAGDFLKLVRTPELACEITLQPLRRFDLDAAILFADILTLAEPMGLGLQIIEGQGPVIQKPIRSEQDRAALPIVIPQHDLSSVLTTIQFVRAQLPDRLPLIGFAGSPWTVAAYLVEGRGTKEFYSLRRMLYQQPELLRSLLTYLTNATIAYAKAQIQAGVHVFMLFDTWGGLLNPAHYLSFSLHYIKIIVKALKQDFPSIPLILYTKNGLLALEERALSGVDALGLDHTVELDVVRQRVGRHVALQGNLDPAVLYASPKLIRHEVKRILTSVGNQPGFIFNVGQGVPLDIPPENIECLVNAVHEETRFP